MLFPILALVIGLVVLVWSADKFVDGAASLAAHYGVPSLLIGMVIIGFGTSAPEMIVSSIAATKGNAGIALGNAYGSNITNIGLILGITALISPIAVKSKILRKELPLLVAVTGLAAWQLWDGQLSRTDALVALAVFTAFVGFSISQALRGKDDAMAAEFDEEVKSNLKPVGASIFWLVTGLVLLVISSDRMVWGAVQIASALGVSDHIIGLTIVACGTSLPELASSISAIRKNEHDLALGNIIGSNLFNTLAVVGIAGVIRPMKLAEELMQRDMLVMSFLTLSLFLFSFGWRKQGRINRIEAAFLLFCYLGYTAYLIGTVKGKTDHADEIAILDAHPHITDETGAKHTGAPAAVFRLQ